MNGLGKNRTWPACWIYRRIQIFLDSHPDFSGNTCFPDVLIRMSGSRRLPDLTIRMSGKPSASRIADSHVGEVAGFQT